MILDRATIYRRRVPPAASPIQQQYEAFEQMRWQVAQLTSEMQLWLQVSGPVWPPATLPIAVLSSPRSVSFASTIFLEPCFLMISPSILQNSLLTSRFAQALIR
jgi:hypothetical protein